MAYVSTDAPVDVVPWDAQQLANPAAAGFNRGCPAGYFAQFVAPGTAGAVDYGNPSAWARCRRLATSNARTIAEESGPTGLEQTLIHVADAAEGFVGGLRDVGELARQAPRGVLESLGIGDLGGYLGLGLVAAVVIGVAAIGLGRR